MLLPTMLNCWSYTDQRAKSIVVMSLDEYNSTIETQYLLQSKYNRERLEKAVENIRAKINLVKGKLIEE